MHELSIAQEIIEISEQYLPQENPVPVKSVKLKIGKLSNVCVDSLQFCFKLLTENSSLKNAELIVQIIPVRIKCSQCNKEVELEENIICCPDCGSYDVSIINGLELYIDELELDDEMELNK